MQKISTLEIEKNSALLHNALEEDIIVTKSNKPFVVVIEYEKYLKLISQKKKSSNWIEKSFGVMPKKEAEALLEDIKQSRVDKDITI